MNFPFGYNKDCTNKEQILAKVRSAILEKDEKHFSDINLQDDTWVPFKEEPVILLATARAHLYS